MFFFISAKFSLGFGEFFSKDKQTVEFLDDDRLYFIVNRRKSNAANYLDFNVIFYTRWDNDDSFFNWLLMKRSYSA